MQNEDKTDNEMLGIMHQVISNMMIALIAANKGDMGILGTSLATLSANDTLHPTARHMLASLAQAPMVMASARATQH